MDIIEALEKIKSYLTSNTLQDLQSSFNTALKLENNLYDEYLKYCNNTRISLDTYIIKDISFEDILKLKGKNYNLSHVEVALSNHLTKINSLCDTVKYNNNLDMRNKLISIQKNKKIIHTDNLDLIFFNSDKLSISDLYHNIQSEINLNNPTKFERPLTYYILTNDLSTYFISVTEIMKELYKTMYNLDDFNKQLYQFIISECMYVLYNWVLFFTKKINEEVRVFQEFSKLGEDKQKLINPEGIPDIVNESVTNIEKNERSLMECVEEAYNIEY